MRFKFYAPPMEEEVPPILRQLRREMAGAWRQDDTLLDKFFPVGRTTDSRYRKAREELYNDDKRFKRWKGIAKNPKASSRLCGRLATLMNWILFHYGISRDKRLFFDTHIRRRGPSNALDVDPGIFLSGIGNEFANIGPSRPLPDYAAGISAFEVALDSDDLMEARDRLAVHMHLIFSEQANRRFAYGLIITQNTFTVYMFDHSGAVGSQPCNYHAHPDRFCAVVSGLASENEKIGFDPTIFGDGPRTKIRTFEPKDDDSVIETCYSVKCCMFQFESLVGRGTICWLTDGPDDGIYVVKDAWIPPSDLAGKESEGSLLRHAQARGVVTGIAQIRFFEEVRCGADTPHLDTVLRNRQVEDTSPEAMKVERVHTRIVMATYGKTLDEFSTRMELLLAFHDAVLAHRQLHDVAGILHRDISVRNILINPEGAEGDRGILIDFDHSIRVGDTSPYSTKEKIGTWRFMSRNVLVSEGPHTYLDDLESFYYVLCWILVVHDGPGSVMEEVSEWVTIWDRMSSSAAKYGLFLHDFELPLAPWFGDSLRGLAVRLHHFFAVRVDMIGKPLASLNPMQDYNEFLAHIRQAIANLENEDLSQNVSPKSSLRESLQPDGTEVPNEPTKPISRKRSREHDSDENLAISLLASRPRRRSLSARVPSPSPPGRRRRRNANYGLPTGS